MSLTRFIKEKEIRDKFNEVFLKPSAKLNGEMKAPPLTKNYPLVGTAFDYLFRFYIKAHNPTAKTHQWVAESALKKMKIFEFNDLYNISEKLIDNTKRVYYDYLQTKKLTDKVLESTIHLAQIDPFFRAGVIDKNLGYANPLDVQDLKNLISLVDINKFNPKKILLLNPEFGIASDLVGGADADFIVDNNLIDIKTTMKPDLKKEDYRQIIGYYILSVIGGIDDAPKDHQLNQISIYSSRYGEMMSFNIPENLDQDFLNWFKEKALKSYPTREF